MDTITVITLIKNSNPTVIIDHDDEFSLQLTSFDLLGLGVGFTNVLAKLFMSSMVI